MHRLLLLHRVLLHRLHGRLLVRRLRVGRGRLLLIGGSWARFHDFRVMSLMGRRRRLADRGVTTAVLVHSQGEQDQSCHEQEPAQQIISDLAPTRSLEAQMTHHSMIESAREA